MTISIVHNAVTAKLHGADRDAKLIANKVLSYMVDGSDHMQAFKSGSWDGRSSFFDFKTESFPRGFVTLVQSALIRAGYKTQVVKKPYPEPLGEKHGRVDDFPEDPRYDYQLQVPDSLERHGQLIAQIATGGGKSKCAKLCVARISRPTLFLTTRSILMYQMRDGFQDMLRKHVKTLPCAVGVIGDGEFSPVLDGINVGMVQTIMARLEETTPEKEAFRMVELQSAREAKEIDALKAKLVKQKASPLEMKKALDALSRKAEKERMPTDQIAEIATRKAIAQNASRAEMKKVLDRFEFVILEEAHEVSGNGFFEILKNCPNAHYRMALTATPFMKDSEESNMRLMASSGPIAVRVSEKELIDRGILAKPYFKFVALKEVPKGLYRSTPWAKAYDMGVTKNAMRNKLITVEALRAKNYGLSTMVLVQRQEHGKALRTMMESAGLRTMFVFGEHEQDERKAALVALKLKKIDVLIGSTILDVGVDVPAVGMVILAGGGKAEVALRQRIGRGLREKKDGSPNVCFVVDFADDHNQHLKGHYLQRRAIIEGTEGFAENIVNDFNFTGLGFSKLAA